MSVVMPEHIGAFIGGFVATGLIFILIALWGRK